MLGVPQQVYGTSCSARCLKIRIAGLCSSETVPTSSDVHDTTLRMLYSLRFTREWRGRVKSCELCLLWVCPAGGPGGFDFRVLFDQLGPRDPSTLCYAMLPGKHRHRPAARPKAGRRADLGSFLVAVRSKSGPEADLEYIDGGRLAPPVALSRGPSRSSVAPG